MWKMLQGWVSDNDANNNKGAGSLSLSNSRLFTILINMFPLLLFNFNSSTSTLSSSSFNNKSLIVGKNKKTKLKPYLLNSFNPHHHGLLLIPPITVHGNTTHLFYPFSATTPNLPSLVHSMCVSITSFSLSSALPTRSTTTELASAALPLHLIFNLTTGTRKQQFSTPIGNPLSPCLRGKSFIAQARS